MRQVQEDCHARILAADTLADVAAILMRKDLTEQEVKRLLGAVHGRNNKIGAAILVQMPFLAVPEPNVPGPRLQLVQTFTVLEHPTLNAGSQGTGISAEQIAIEVLQLFHHWIPYGVTQVFVGGPDAIVPDVSLDGLVAYTVTVSTFVALAKPDKVARPTISADGLTVTLACATSGASIVYSTDGSYPTTAYAGPFTLPAAATVRAAASKPDMQQSDVAQASIG